MIQYAVVRPDARDPAYGYVLSTHHTLRRAQAAQRRYTDAETLILYYKPGLPTGGSTIALDTQYVVPHP